MARSKPSAREALRKVREEREALDQREAQLRKEAAADLGKVLVDCGAETIEPGQLRELIQRTMLLGIGASLERLAAA